MGDCGSVKTHALACFMQCKQNFLKPRPQTPIKQCNCKKISAQMQKQPLEVFLGKGVLKICNKFTGEHQFRSAISVKLQSNFIEIALWQVFSAVNLLYIFRKLFPKNTSGRLLLALFSHYFTEPKIPQKIKNAKHLVETLYCFLRHCKLM